MNLSAPFIKRPVATTLLAIAVVIAGLIAFVVLPVAPLPQVDFPTINVSGSLPGASAETMAATVATPLERQFSRIAGITEMTSQSLLGKTSVTLQFDLDRNIDGAARDVQAAISAARSYLPANLPADPTYRKVNPADAPIMILSLTSPTYRTGELYDYASTIVAQRLSQLPGVGQVTVGGSSLPAIRVDVDPTQLASYGLALTDLRGVLQQQNTDLARGQISDGDDRFRHLLTNGQILHAVDYKPIVLATRGGTIVRLSDVADVHDGKQNIRTAGYMDGKPSVTLVIFRQPGANIIDTVDRIRAAMPSIEATIPTGIDTTIVLDRTTTIRASVHDVEHASLLSVVLVVLVVFVFLRDVRATAIPSIAVPTSLIGTFAVMYLLGYSLDNLSLMALTIATGFVVDDAIVVMENIARHREAGMAPMDAALLGAREIGFTVLTISLSLVAVFIPILAMQGIVGRLFREFAVTLSVAILISMIVSLTATPMLCARVLKAEPPRQGALMRLFERGFDLMLAGYRRSLAWVFDNRGLVLVVLLLTIVMNVVLVIRVPKGFFPQQDTGVVFGGMLGPQDASFAAMDASSRRLVDIIRKDPAVEHVNAFTNAANSGFIFMALKPLERARRERDARDRASARRDEHGCRWRRYSCRPPRTCASAAGCRARSTSTRSRPTTSPTSRRGAPSSSTR